MPKFQIGDRVRGNKNASRYGITGVGVICEVVNDRHVIEGYFGAAVVYKDNRLGQAWSVREDCFDLDHPKFDPKRPVFVRETGERVELRRRKDEDRPYEATLTHPKLGKIDLTFTSSGRFIESGDSPVDLTNAS